MNVLSDGQLQQNTVNGWSHILPPGREVMALHDHRCQLTINCVETHLDDGRNMYVFISHWPSLLTLTLYSLQNYHLMRNLKPSHITIMTFLLPWQQHFNGCNVRILKMKLACAGIIGQ